MTNSTTDKNTSQSEITLPAPTFPLANENNAIEAIGSAAGTYVDVAAYPGVRLGDIVTLSMHGFVPLEGATPVPASDFLQAQVVLEIKDKLLSFFVPKVNLTAICRGNAKAQYTVTRDNKDSHSHTGHVLVDMRIAGRCVN